ncbi:hypothetical protein AMATHDRAFT_10039 [Amanita thiersii Skay4041]|uniref:Ricin B lectin domain-containing protein n=1 Tax=Amanita thiersii Skay4041 TaxID=703135 RepID=A0A2A9N6C1_9AGAR|nr:hypothetical protein AMATHDRAFT_10039 [Amanita thiersii Skay4041]
MSESLQSGHYFIYHGNDLVGRDRREDRSLLPKHIFNKTDDKEPQWTIEALHDGRYKLYARGSPTGVEKGHVVAFLINQARAEEWHITPIRGLKGEYEISSGSKAFWEVSEPGKHSMIKAVPSTGRPEKETIPNPRFIFKIVAVPVGHEE